jgi:hypothetical protein
MSGVDRRRWHELERRIAAALYESDPEGMGASVGAPHDEYADVARAVIRALRDRQPEQPFGDAVTSVLPSANSELISELEHIWQDVWRGRSD